MLGVPDQIRACLFDLDGALTQIRRHGVRAYRFGFVIGVDRAGQADTLRAYGAAVAVTDLAKLLEHP